MINKIEVGILPYHYPSYFFRRKDTAYVKNMRVNIFLTEWGVISDTFLNFAHFSIQKR